MAGTLRTPSCGWWRLPEALPLDTDLYIFKSMMLEEWRLHKSFQGAVGSHLFPLVIFLFSAFIALVSPIILTNIDVPRILLILHAAAFSYGIFVGAMGYIGEHAMTRRLGQVNMLLQMPQIYPVGFRRMMAIFFLKDAVYYILYSIIPLMAGIAVGAPFAGVTILSVARLGITVFLTFMTGMGVSFLVSAVAVSSRDAAACLGLLILFLASLIWPFEAIEASWLLLPLGYWDAYHPLYLLSSAIVATVLSVGAVLMMKERFETPQRTHSEMLGPALRMFSDLGGLGTLLAKEWVELRRSGTLAPVVTGYIAPLVSIYAIVWIFGEGIGIPLCFNAVSYGGFVGFLGVTVYSWVTNLESNEFLNAQPVTIYQVIKAKLVLYFLLTTVVSAGYVVSIAVANGQMNILPLALLASFSNNVYVAAVIARLTGLWTNTMLFDAKVLSKFAGAVVPPLVTVLFASFMLPSDSSLAAQIVVAVSALLLLVSVPIFKSVRGRWRGTPFSFVTT